MEDMLETIDKKTDSLKIKIIDDITSLITSIDRVSQ